MLSFAIKSPKVALVQAPLAGFSGNGLCYVGTQLYAGMPNNPDGNTIGTLNKSTGVLNAVGYDEFGYVESTIKALAPIDSGRVIVFVDDVTMPIINTADGQVLREPTGLPPNIDLYSTGGVCFDNNSIVFAVPSNTSTDYIGLFSLPAPGASAVLSGSITLGMGTKKVGNLTKFGSNWMIADRNANGVFRLFDSSFVQSGIGTLTYMAALPSGLAAEPDGSLIATGDDGYIYEFWRTDGAQTISSNGTFLGGTIGGGSTLTFTGKGTITASVAGVKLDSSTIIAMGSLTIAKGAGTFSKTGTVWKVGPQGVIAFSGFTDNPIISGNGQLQGIIGQD